ARVRRDVGAAPRGVGGRVIHLYAIALELENLPPVAGVGGASVRRSKVDGLELVVSEHEPAALDPTDENVLSHARVVEAVAGASTHSRAAAPRLLLSGAYLIPAADVERFRTRLAELEQTHPELTFVCTGPWPPYSFATALEA